MNFEDAVEAIPTKNRLKRVASAHVVDYQHLDEAKLRANILRTKNQYTHPESIENALTGALYNDDDLGHRVLAELIVIDVLLNEYGHLLPLEELAERVLQKEQDILNESNERDLKDLSGGREDTEHYKNLCLYDFVLKIAWEHRDTKSIDEANLLRKLRKRLGVTSNEHRILEAKIGKYPKGHNELHSKSEIREAVRILEQLGLLFQVRNDANVDFAVIPEDIVQPMKKVLGVEMRRPGYMQLLRYKAVRKKPYLQRMLEKSGIAYSSGATVAELQERVADTLQPAVLLGGHSPKDGLNNQNLYQWCSDLRLPVAGRKEDRIQRIVEHYNQLQFHQPDKGDPRQRWYEFYHELACRDRQTLRAQHIIEKDIDIDRYFEEATSYLFEKKLNQTPLRQAGTEHCDGLLSFRDKYVMWDNKSSEIPVNLKTCIRQFDSYMHRSDKPVPIFLMIGPGFTPGSELVALRYTADNIGRNIALIEADELKEVAELWSREGNKQRSEPFPLGLFASPGRFQIDSIRPSFA